MMRQTVQSRTFASAPLVSDSLSPLGDYPADLLRLLVCRCPGKRKKVRETHFASFVLDFPSRKVARDELIVLSFFVNNAEVVPGIVTRISSSKTSTDNFRSPETVSCLYRQLGYRSDENDLSWTLWARDL